MKDIDQYAIVSRAARLRAVNPYRLSPFYEDAKKYPSASPKKLNTSRKERMEYTGTYIKGIGTMHKSNSIPITSAEQAIDLAHMRR